MKRLFPLLMVTMAAVSITGCARITSEVVEKPRVDQELEGNRGYLVGSAPPAPERKSTRQVLETNIELPTRDELNPWRRTKSSAPSAPPTGSSRAPAYRSIPAEPQETDEISVAPDAPPASTPASTIYVVERGDTLEKIAAKVYGDSNQWRRIYKANPEKLKSPSKIYPGQKLVIPSYQKPSKRVSSSTIK